MSPYEVSSLHATSECQLPFVVSVASIRFNSTAPQPGFRHG